MEELKVDGCFDVWQVFSIGHEIISVSSRLLLVMATYYFCWSGVVRKLQLWMRNAYLFFFKARDKSVVRILNTYIYNENLFMKKEILCISL